MPEGLTVTAIPDGRLLVFGGGGAQTWNPERRSWEPDVRAQDLSRRYHHSATPTPGGRVVAIGGIDVPFTNRTQQPALATTATWRSRSGQWEKGPSLLSPRLWHAAVALPPDDILVIGGVAAATGDKPFGALLTSVELVGENTSVQRASLRVARIRHAATRLADGRVLVTGGVDDTGAPLSSTEIYDPRADRWQMGGSLAAARSQHAATLLADGRVLISGGRDAKGRAMRSTEIYDPARDAWTRGSDLIEARWDHEAPLLGDGSVLVAGGWVREQYTASGVESWIASDGAWRTAGYPMRSLRDAHVVPLADGTVLLFGQDPYDSAVVQAWRRDFTDDAPPALPHDGAFTALSDGRFLLAGGTRRQAPSPFVNVFDPRAGTWSALRPVPHARTNPRAIGLGDGRLVVFGGDVADDDSDLRAPVDERPTHPALIWDPEREDWTPSAALAMPDGGWAEPTLLPDGRVLLLGLDTSGRGDLVAMYRIWDPRDDSIEGPVRVPRPRFGGAVLGHPDGSILLLGSSNGGDTDESRRADRWDRDERRWRALKPAPVSLEGAEFIALDDGGALAFWRYAAANGSQHPYLRLLPDGSWRTLPTPPVAPRSVLLAQSLKDGALLLVVDGVRSWVHEPQSEGWLPILHDARWTEHLKIVPMPDGGALAFRSTGDRGYGMDTLDVVRLERSKGRWEPLAPGWQARPDPALVDLGKGEVLAAGGGSAIVQVYQATTDHWRYEAFLPEPLDRPVALRTADGRVMLAGTTMGEAPAALCLSWAPGDREWIDCGRFQLAPGEPRRPMTLRQLDAKRLLLVYGDGRAVIRDSSGTWTASRMQLPQSPVPPDADAAGKPFNVALAGIWDPQKSTWADATDAWLANAAQVVPVRGSDPSSPWIVQWNRWRRWDSATRTLTAGPLGNPPADGEIGEAVSTGANCAAAWNDSKDARDRTNMLGGATTRTIQAVDLAAGQWQDAPPPALPAWKASGLTLADGTLLIAGLGFEDDRPGTGFARYRASCGGVLPLSGERVLWLPARAAAHATATRDARMPPPKREATLPERMRGALQRIVDEVLEHPQRTALPGLLLLFLGYGRMQRRAIYADMDAARTLRAIDAGIAMAGLPLAFAALAIPHEVVRLGVMAVCALAASACVYRLWQNAERHAAKYGLFASLVACGAFAVLLGGLALVQLFRLMFANLTA